MKASRNNVQLRLYKSFRFIAMVSAILLCLSLLLGCSTRRAIRLKRKSLNQWEEKKNIEPKIQSINIEDSIKDPNSFDIMLSRDFRLIAEFSQKNANFGITKESFSQMFWEGIHRSYEFYHSSEHINQTTIKHYFNREFYTHSELSQPIEKPNIIDANLSEVFSSFSRFSGEWHGMWEKKKVHHLWLPAKNIHIPLTNQVILLGFQSCFIGDGIGWNYVLKEQNKIKIYGFVCHYNDDGKISAMNPHYAFLNDKGHIFWVSENHLYFEYTRLNFLEKRQYVITGIRYKRELKTLNLKSRFQAIYLSEDHQLPDFKSL